MHERKFFSLRYPGRKSKKWLISAFWARPPWSPCHSLLPEEHSNGPQQCTANFMPVQHIQVDRIASRT
jgi:hypothetical protein